MEDSIGGPLRKIPTKLKDTFEEVRRLNNKSNSDMLIKFYEYIITVITFEIFQSGIIKGQIKYH